MSNPLFHYYWSKMSRSATVHLFFLYAIHLVSIRTNGEDVLFFPHEFLRFAAFAVVSFGGAALISLVLCCVYGWDEDDNDDNDDDPSPDYEPPSGGIFLTYWGKCHNNANYLMLNA